VTSDVRDYSEETATFALGTAGHVETTQELDIPRVQSTCAVYAGWARELQSAGTREAAEVNGMVRPQ